MAEWSYTGEPVSNEKAAQSLEAVKSACFGCASHSDDCSIARAAEDINRMLEEK